MTWILTKELMCLKQWETGGSLVSCYVTALGAVSWFIQTGCVTDTVYVCQTQLLVYSACVFLSAGGIRLPFHLSSLEALPVIAGRTKVWNWHKSRGLRNLIRVSVVTTEGHSGMLTSWAVQKYTQVQLHFSKDTFQIYTFFFLYAVCLEGLGSQKYRKVHEEHLIKIFYSIL